jgi:hypothetical protein
MLAHDVTMLYYSRHHLCVLPECGRELLLNYADRDNNNEHNSLSSLT